MGGYTLSKVVKIALDAMGGDSAPASVVDGADIAKAKSPHIEILFVGDEKIVRPLLERSKFFKNAEVFHTDQAVSSGDLLCRIHAKDENSAHSVSKIIQSSFTLSEDQPRQLPMVGEILD